MTADVLLLIAVALVVTLVWMGKGAPSWLLLMLSILSYPMIFVGIAGVTLSLVDAYMVGIDRVPPGEPMFLDELAYPLRDALLDLMKGVGFLILAFFSRDYARRKKLEQHGQ